MKFLLKYAQGGDPKGEFTTYWLDADEWDLDKEGFFSMQLPQEQSTNQPRLIGNYLQISLIGNHTGRSPLFITLENHD